MPDDVVLCSVKMWRIDKGGGSRMHTVSRASLGFRCIISALFDFFGFAVLLIFISRRGVVSAA